MTAHTAAGSSEMMTIRCICTDKPKCEYYISYIAGEILRKWGAVRLRSSFFGAFNALRLGGKAYELNYINWKTCQSSGDPGNHDSKGIYITGKVSVGSKMKPYK